MFDIGWQELVVIGVLAIVVLGPKELPRVLRTVMGLMRKARSVASEFQEAINDAARQADLDDVKKKFTDSALNPTDAIRHSIDPNGEMRQEIQSLAHLDDYVRDQPAPTAALAEIGTALPPPESVASVEPPKRSGDNG